MTKKKVMKKTTLKELSSICYKPLDYQKEIVKINGVCSSCFRYSKYCSNCSYYYINKRLVI